MCIKDIKTSFQNFLREEDGNISVMTAILLPVFLWLTAYFETEMQAQYIYTQTQFVLDMATRAGASTGEAVASSHNVFCTIPLNDSKPDQSGYHCAIQTLEDNLHTLPVEIQEQIQTQIDQHKIRDLEDTDLRAAGVVEMRMTLWYTPRLPVFFNRYVFYVESSSKCQAVRPAGF
ncbi:TadE/TadG family type IV pilus assembly protein [Ileibacterium valens]|uniref:TadE/TadG family type IV pilus assembly protein n=1 Tax=Ileibacterium valens TaxID=1862668 RepID=UPI002570F0F1|nr:hypothetical protein [Ileibacterium valens]